MLAYLASTSLLNACFTYLLFYERSNKVQEYRLFEMEKALFRHDQESNLRKIQRKDACTSSHFKFLLGMGRTQETSCFNECLTIMEYDCSYIAVVD